MYVVTVVILLDCYRATTLTHVNEVAVVPRHEVAKGRQLVGHVQDVLAGGIASTNPHRLLFSPSTQHQETRTTPARFPASRCKCFERLKTTSFRWVSR